MNYLTTVPTEVPQVPDKRLHARRLMVRRALVDVLDSHHFRKSKRYPALLEYVVKNTLAGNLSALKERIIGSEVFGRPADYDTNNDPVVRLAAGEVRKRLAMYFSEHPESPVRITLPLGSYIAGFHFPEAEPDLSTAEVGDAGEQVECERISFETLPFPQTQVRGILTSLGKRRWQLLSCSLIVCMGVGLAVWRYYQLELQQDFWWPILHNAAQASILVAPSASNPLPVDKTQVLTPNTVAKYDMRVDQHLVMGVAVATANTHAL